MKQRRLDWLGVVMEVINDRSDEKPFNEIVWGECFLYEKTLHIKTKADNLSIRLHDGETFQIAEETMVLPVKTKVVVT